MMKRSFGIAVAALAIGLIFGAGQMLAQGRAPIFAPYWSPQLTAAQQQEQSFSGTIAKTQEGVFVLQVGDQVYQLDNQTEAARFDGQKVKVTGVLDSKSMTIQVKTIERAG